MATAQDAKETAAEPAAAPSRSEPPPAEIAFLEAFGVPRVALVEATQIAFACGVTADRALLAGGTLSAEQFYRMLARHLGVAFMDDALPVAGTVSIDTAMEVEIVPLAPNAKGVDFAIAPRGETLRRLLQRFGPHRPEASLRVAVTTPRRLAALVRRRHRRALVRDASHGLSDWNPRLSALGGWSTGQQVFGFLFGFAVAVGVGASPSSTFEALCLVFCVLFLAMVAVRLLATACSPAPADPQPPRLPDDQLPVYTVVVPLYHERSVVPQLVRALARLDYPVLGSKLTKA